MPLLKEEDLEAISKVVKDEREQRNNKQDPKAEETYTDFQFKVCNGLISKDKSKFLPDLPASMEPQHSSASPTRPWMLLKLPVRRLV